MRVTVVMPVYNAMPYLPLTVSSLFEQSLRDFALVAVDDCSTDDSLEYLRSIADPRLTIIRLAQRGGQGAARNAALELCKTEYVAFVDADDICLPRRLEQQVSYLDRHPAIGMLGTGIRYIGPSGRLGPSPPLSLNHLEIRRDLLQGRHAIVNGSLMFRAGVFERTGVFRISGPGEDWDLFLRMTERTEVANLPQILLHVRLHAKSTNATQARALHLRYAHACECAINRESSLPEATFEDFCNRQLRRPLWFRLLDQLAQISLAQYRAGIAAIAEGETLEGYGRVAVASLLAPKKLARHAGRRLRRHFQLPRSKGSDLP